VVALGVVGPDHGRVARGQDRPAEPGEVGRPAGQRPPGEAGAPPVGGVVDQVDGIGLAVGVEVVAGTDPRVESLRARRRRRTAEAIVAGASELFEERGFERTTIDQIADAAEISRRTFFRYFADKEEVFFAEDERLLASSTRPSTAPRTVSPCSTLPAARPGPLPPTAPPIPGAAWPTSG
jgi:hypothetical protein